MKALLALIIPVAALRIESMDGRYRQFQPGPSPSPYYTDDVRIGDNLYGSPNDNDDHEHHYHHHHSWFVDRPYREVRQSYRRKLPPMEIEQKVIKQKHPHDSPSNEEEIYLLRRNPHALYCPVVESKWAVKERSIPLAAPIQLLPSCDMFEVSWHMMLELVNEYRREAIGSRLESNGTLCMNAKMMQAAKLQSDFQGLAKIPTHAGPRRSGFGNLEERLQWFGFGKTPSTTEGGTINTFEADEVIYYWPAGPRILPKVTMQKRLREAMQAWKHDPRASSILANPKYQFFGYGYYRSSYGAMYMTVIVATSSWESCNVCPDDATKLQLAQQPFEDEYEHPFA